MCSWCRKFNWTVFPVMFLLVPYYIIYLFKKGVCGVLPHSTCILKLQTGVFAFAPAFYNRLLFRIFRVWPWECIFGAKPLRDDEAENTIRWYHAVTSWWSWKYDSFMFAWFRFLACRMWRHAQNTNWHELCFLLCFSLDFTTAYWWSFLLVLQHSPRCQGHTFSMLNLTLDKNQRWYKIINHSGGV